MRPRRSSSAGFTLLEVLVALAVLAIALAAVLRSMGQAIDISVGMRERTLALWVAQERATDHQLKRQWPAIDTRDGTQQFGGREWRWRERVSSTTVQDLRRVDIEVGVPGSDNTLARLAVFVVKP
jgi:general secretion pathway protein I